MDKNNSYDYIIGGGGASGLLLAYHIVSDSALKAKRVLIVEPSSKNTNDRTWSSWVKSDHPLNHIASKSWKSLEFVSNNFKQTLRLHDYNYRMIRSFDFYKYMNTILKISNQITWETGKIESYKPKNNQVEVTVNDNTYVGQYFFKSYIDYKIDKENYLYVDQHFMGWFIESKQPVFDAEVCTFMDFSIEDGTDTRFMYVMPTSSRKALVELAVFSIEDWTTERYENILEGYIKTTFGMDKGAYEIHEKEQGSIPMTSYPFSQHDTDSVVHIGTAAGAVKPSSGYAFERIYRHSAAVAKALATGKSPSIAQKVFMSRFKLYDKTLLNLLIHKPELSGQIFGYLFKKNKVEQVLKFLDEDTNLKEEIKLMSTTNIPLFLKSFIQVATHRK